MFIAYLFDKLKHITLNNLLYVLALILEKYYIRIFKGSVGTSGLSRMLNFFKQRRIYGKDIVRYT